MPQITIGVLRETKTPPDFRVVLSPVRALEIMKLYPEIKVVVQPSYIRSFADEQYTAAGIELREDLRDCDILVGVKEVKKETLIPEKTYFFFSHTIKKQPHNASLLKTILDKRIRLIDYELIKDSKGKRLIGFGRYAGIVGCYNGMRLFGEKHRLFSLKPAHKCADRTEMRKEMSNIVLPAGLKIVLTGFGRVGNGAVEILTELNVKQVSVADFLSKSFNEPVFCHPDTGDCFRRISDGGYEKKEFYAHPEMYYSIFPEYCQVADLFVACHFWQKGSPAYFTAEDTKSKSWKTMVVADVSCDVGGPVGTTLRSTTISDPFFGFNPVTQEEVDFHEPGAIAVMAIDNLPCELPKDASDDFGNEFIANVLPEIANGDANGILEAATETTFDGKLTADFAYLLEYALNG